MSLKNIKSVRIALRVALNPFEKLTMSNYDSVMKRYVLMCSVIVAV